jgi:hypothetical protein
MKKNNHVSCILYHLSCIIYLATSVAFAQVDIYGYFEPQYAGLILDTTYYQSTYGKVRIDLKSTEIKNVRSGADIIYLNYFGKKDWNILDFLPDNITSSIPPEMLPYYQLHLKDTFYLDNAFVRLSVRKLAVMVGKQQISFGTGYFSNPTDVFNAKDVLDPTYEQPGHNAIRLEVYPVPRVSLTALYTPIEWDWESSGKLGRIKVGLGHFDISAIGYLFQHTSTDFYTFQKTTQERIMMGGDIVGELFGCGIWSEGIYNIMANKDDNSYEFLFGGDYTFEGGLYTMLEYHHNSLGKTDYKDYNLNDWMRYITGEVKTLSRNQIYGLIQHPITDFVSIGSMGVFSISDQSAALIPMVNYSMFENVDITLMLNIYTGEEGKAFNHSFGNGGLVRANVYF